MALFAASRRFHASRSVGWSLVLVLAALAIVITHHVTTYVFIAILGVWAFFFLLNGRQRDFFQIGWTTILAVVASTIWVLYVASITIHYLVPQLQGALDGLVRIILNETSSRQLFTDYAGVSPLWEKGIGYFSALLVLLGLPSGLFRVWKNYRQRATILLLSAIAVAYPATQVFRFAPSGVDIAGRFSPFLYIGLSFIIAIGIAEFWLPAPLKRTPHLLFTGLTTLIFWGGAILSFPRAGRLPGPYLVGADMRSVDQLSIATAQWAQDLLTPDNHIGADRVNGLLISTYGRQFQITRNYYGINVPEIYYSSALGPSEEEIMREGDLRYLIVDLRLSDDLPLFGIYFEREESSKLPLRIQALTKFDGVKDISRVYDSGDIVIYDVGLISNAP